MATNRAYEKKNRTNRNSATDHGAISSYQTNPYSGGQKGLAVGPEFLKQDANAFVSGRDVSGAGESIAPGSSLYIYNNSGSTAWIALSTAAIGAAPSSFSDGIPLRPNDWTLLAAGENSFVRSSSIAVGLYEVKDDTVFTPQN